MPFWSSEKSPTQPQKCKLQVVKRMRGSRSLVLPPGWHLALKQLIIGTWTCFSKAGCSNSEEADYFLYSSNCCLTRGEIFEDIAAQIS